MNPTDPDVIAQVMSTGNSNSYPSNLKINPDGTITVVNELPPVGTSYGYTLKDFKNPVQSLSELHALNEIKEQNAEIIKLLARLVELWEK